MEGRGDGVRHMLPYIVGERKAELRGAAAGSGEATRVSMQPEGLLGVR